MARLTSSAAVRTWRKKVRLPGSPTAPVVTRLPASKSKLYEDIALFSRTPFAAEGGHKNAGRWGSGPLKEGRGYVSTPVWASANAPGIRRGPECRTGFIPIGKRAKDWPGLLPKMRCEIVVRPSLDPRWWHRNLTTFQKVVVANSAIIAAGAITGPLITLNFSGRTRLPFLLGLLAIGLVAILVANFLILRLAFKPMRELETTMSSVQPGVDELRVHANFSDPDLRRIATVFNSMLDRLEHERHLSAQRVLQAQERERQRVARELHDQTGQALTHEIISLDLLLERTGDVKARQQLEAVKRTLEETLEEVHRMYQDPRPSVLDALGLVPALRPLAKQPSGAQVALKVDGLRDRLPAPIETALYRIAQEALTNTNKYARASHVDIDLRCLDRHVRLRVRDDGVGFDPESIPEREEPGRAGLGIFGMRERATLLRGTLEIHSAPLKGTEVVAQLPLEDNHAG